MYSSEDIARLVVDEQVDVQVATTDVGYRCDRFLLGLASGLVVKRAVEVEDEGEVFELREMRGSMVGIHRLSHFFQGEADRDIRTEMEKLEAGAVFP